ncbi:MAG TPA: SpoIIE family protein phosphatase [Roseiflexaceae bacterium]|nr:SpoIIE family protein phosphatase [Roseiflexaceae bacterium]
MSTLQPAESIADLRALVVDDNAVINQMIRLQLANLGFQVAGVGSGESGLAYLADTGADILFLDVSLPGMSGLEVLRQVREQQPDLAIIMTTAFSSERIVTDVLRLGANDYLCKPFEAAEFRAVINRTVGQLLLHRQNTELRRQLDEKHRQLQAELARAAEVQAELLPREMPMLEGFELAAECVPTQEVGGDFYDWHQPSQQFVSLWLCDVMGKGMPAALLMATVRAVMRAVVRDSPPAEALRYVSAALEPDFARTDRFVTLLIAQLDITTRRLRYVDAGHGHVFVRRSNGHVESLQPRGLPLGVTPKTSYQEGECTFGPGDALVVYSDGLVDARPDLRLDASAIAGYLDGTGSALAMVDRLVALIGPAGVPPDDTTLLVLRCDDTNSTSNRSAAHWTNHEYTRKHTYES